ncbi:hypothetical protein [Cupriavidus pampae]|uniref:Uncharacterized protein n=1 Tax=Cupriavidus pampae TaxID=659251 RepID=A0ABN7ZED1_9BURK|nr:hypothetical protein [Cupriavidus pampae]CAG9184333.1 hypothetical protein LMG32289_05588 [Cupriavidus pampae]
MIDFAKLSDPDHMAAAKREREAFEAAQEALHRRRRAAVNLLTQEDPIYAALTPRERDFVRNIQRNLNTYSPLSTPQHDWLMDITARFGSAYESVPGHYVFTRDSTMVSVHGGGLADHTTHTDAASLLAWASAHGVAAEEATASFCAHSERLTRSATIPRPAAATPNAGPSLDY